MPDDPLDRLERAAERIVGRGAYEQANRRGLLWVHACMGLFAGPQMLLWGSATVIETSVGPWSRYAMGVVGLVGGVLLAVGLSRRVRVVSLEAVGLALVGVWDLAMVVGLLVARIQQNDYRLIGFLAPLHDGYVVAYPITVYAGLLALICVHLWTLRRLFKSGMKGRRQ